MVITSTSSARIWLQKRKKKKKPMNQVSIHGEKEDRLSRGS